MTCDCIAKVDSQLAARGLGLKLRPTIDTKTLEMGIDLSLETVSLKKGVKPKPLFMPYCPFCGRKNL